MGQEKQLHIAHLPYRPIAQVISYFFRLTHNRFDLHLYRAEHLNVSVYCIRKIERKLTYSLLLYSLFIPIVDL